MAVYVQGGSYAIDDGVSVIATPGHTGADVSLIVQNTAHGTVLLAGKNECEFFICTYLTSVA